MRARERMRHESPPASRSIPLGARPDPCNKRWESEVSEALAPGREEAPSRRGSRVHGARSPIRTEKASDFHDRFRLTSPPGVEWRQASDSPESTSRRNETLWREVPSRVVAAQRSEVGSERPCSRESTQESESSTTTVVASASESGVGDWAKAVPATSATHARARIATRKAG